MNAISLDRIRIMGIVKLESILSIQITVKVNEHGYMRIRGILDTQEAKEYAFKPIEGGELTLQCDNGDGFHPYFAGYIQEASVTFENQAHYFDALCVSGSRKFDISKSSKSFQNTKMTYKQLLRSLGDGIGNVVSISNKDLPIGFPIVKYEETNWQLMKRLASRFNTVVIPDVTTTFPQVAVGVVTGKTYELNTQSFYKIENLVGRYRNKKAYHNCKPNDFICYKLREYCNFSLGDKVKYNGITYIVMEKITYLLNGILENEYTIGSENGFGLTRQINQKIGGLSLQGNVIWASGERVKVHLDIDDEQNKSEAFPFTFVPVSGNIMYAMPEIDARISIYFPSADESSAYAVSCQKSSRATYPFHHNKYFSTPKGKHMVLSPFKATFHSKKRLNSNSVSIVDRVGASLSTTKAIRIKAKKKISMQSKGFCWVKAISNLKLIQSENSYLEISESNMYINTPKVVTSAMPCKSSGSSKVCNKIPCIPDVSNAVPAVLGGLTSGRQSGMAATALGAMPLCCNPSTKLTPGSLGMVFSEH